MKAVLVTCVMAVLLLLAGGAECSRTRERVQLIDEIVEIAHNVWNGLDSLQQEVARAFPGVYTEANALVQAEATRLQSSTTFPAVSQHAAQSNSVPGCTVHDVKTALDVQNLGTSACAAPQYEALNHLINEGYSNYAKCFQTLVSGLSPSVTDWKLNTPVWPVIAPYASRGVGKGEIAVLASNAAVTDATTALSTLSTALTALNTGLSTAYGQVTSPSTALTTATNAINAFKASVFAAILKTYRAAMFLVAAGTISPVVHREIGRHPDLALHAVEHMLKAVTPATCGTTPVIGCCVAAFAAAAPTQASMMTAARTCINSLTIVGTNLAKVPTTIRNTLHDGNYRIYSDIGSSMQGYLTWRDTAVHASGAFVPPRDAAITFCEAFMSDSSARPAGPGGASISAAAARAQCATVYAHVRQQADQLLQHASSAAVPISDVPSDFSSLETVDASNPRKTTLCTNKRRDPGMLALAASAFAMYEEAGANTNMHQRDALIMYGNNLLAWVEQSVAVQPAFTPCGPVPNRVDPPNELSRPSVFKGMTVTVSLEFPHGLTWTNYGFQRNRVKRTNWSTFSERWPPILDAFRAAYDDRDKCYLSNTQPFPDPWAFSGRP